MLVDCTWIPESRLLDRSDRCWMALDCCTGVSESFPLLRRRQSTGPNCASFPSSRPQDTGQCCTSGSGSLGPRKLFLRWRDEGCRMCGTAASALRYTTDCRFPSRSKDSSYHELDKGHYCKNRSGRHSLHICSLHTVEQDQSSPLSSVWHPLHTTQYRRSSWPRGPTCHQLGSVFRCKLASVFLLQHSRRH